MSIFPWQCRHLAEGYILAKVRFAPEAVAFGRIFFLCIFVAHQQASRRPVRLEPGNRGVG